MFGQHGACSVFICGPIDQSFILKLWEIFDHSDAREQSLIHFNTERSAVTDAVIVVGIFDIKFLFCLFAVCGNTDSVLFPFPQLVIVLLLLTDVSARLNQHQ